MKKKKAGKELDSGPRIGVINAFLEEEIPRMDEIADDLECEDIPIDNINKVFKEIINFF